MDAPNKMQLEADAFRASLAESDAERLEAMRKADQIQRGIPFAEYKEVRTESRSFIEPIQEDTDESPLALDPPVTTRYKLKIAFTLTAYQYSSLAYTVSGEAIFPYAGDGTVGNNVWSLSGFTYTVTTPGAGGTVTYTSGVGAVWLNPNSHINPSNFGSPGWMIFLNTYEEGYFANSDTPLSTTPAGTYNTSAVDDSAYNPHYSGIIQNVVVTLVQ